MQDGPFTLSVLESRRMRTHTRVSLVGYAVLFSVAAILIVADIQQGWWVGGVAVGWAAASLARGLIDAHYIIKRS
jgi:hypothetical protein